MHEPRRITNLRVTGLHGLPAGLIRLCSLGGLPPGSGYAARSTPTHP
ncbi:MAG: hypothetical protein ACRDRA_02705 [Pseudonocardiaceae bacterium]